jgi:hypothetical protein
MPSLLIIGEVKVTPSEVFPGESVPVDVKDLDGTSYNNAEVPCVRINNVTGSRQFLQFSRPGVQTIHIVAEKNGKTEHTTTTVDATTRPAGFESATYGLEIRCSIQLSYGRSNSQVLPNITTFHAHCQLL